MIKMLTIFMCLYKGKKTNQKTPPNSAEILGLSYLLKSVLLKSTYKNNTKKLHIAVTQVGSS